MSVYIRVYVQSESVCVYMYLQAIFPPTHFKVI